jgi:hypothetical protein
MLKSGKSDERGSPRRRKRLRRVRSRSHEQYLSDSAAQAALDTPPIGVGILLILLALPDRRRDADDRERR